MKRILIIVVALMVALAMVSPSSATTKKVHKAVKCKAVKCKAVKVVKVAKPKAKSLKAEKMQAVNCPVCGGKSKNCPYWITDINGIQRHMTEQEIKEFDWLEWHYLASDGQWYEVRTGNTEPVEKPDYVRGW